MILNESTTKLKESKDIVFEIVDVDKFIKAFECEELNESSNHDAYHSALIRGAIGANNFSTKPTRSEIARQNNEVKIPPELVGMALALATRFGIRRKD